jgi:hypothetical protein
VKAFVVTETLGRVAPGEVVSIKFLGDVEGARYTYPNFKVSRKPPAETTSAKAGGGTIEFEDDIPF